jgi:hypothetical protein
MVTAKNYLGLPVEKATPIARPSIKLCKRELNKFR